MLSLYEDWRGERALFLSLFYNTNKLVLLLYIVLYSPLFNLKQKDKKNEKILMLNKLQFLAQECVSNSVIRSYIDTVILLKLWYICFHNIIYHL